jgi:integrase
MHQRFTDRKLQSLKPGKKRYEVMDSEVRGLGVRVTERGQRTFILIARYPHSHNPTRRALGDYPTLSLEKARAKARRWRELLEEGKDPKDEDERLTREELRKRADTFDSIVDEYTKRVLARHRRGHIVARELRTFFAERWKSRPITSIERREVIDVINEIVDRGAIYQAHNLLGHARALFNWAIATEAYGLERSPCDRLRPKLLIGERKPSQRVLDDAELAAFWRATEAMGYPYGSLLKLLLLTGCRKSEIGDARWPEIDLTNRLLTVPAERFKSDATHVVPLSNAALAILETLPRFTKGECIFSSTFGLRSVSGYARAKERLDKLMAAQLDGDLKPFRIHDLRRTVRTRLSSLKVSREVAELVIGHGKKGLDRVYDQHQFLDEMREALEMWAARLRSIVTPPPKNVVGLGDYLRARV